jgi:uncharacterized protein (TIGR02266 family)
MGSAEPAETSESGSESFERLRLRMQALQAPTAPHVDPQALAVGALRVAGRLGQTDMLRRVDALGRAGVCDPRGVADLRLAARSLTYALSRRGVARDLGDSPHASALRTEALGLKRACIETLDALDTDEARLWLEVFRLPSNDLELVFDLRSIALLYEEQGSALGEGFDRAGSLIALRRSADALEAWLEGPGATLEWNQWVARAFSLARSLYLEAWRIGKCLEGGPGGLALEFPSIAGIARSARRNRGPTSFTQTVPHGAGPLTPQSAADEREPPFESSGAAEPDPEPALAPTTSPDSGPAQDSEPAPASDPEPAPTPAPKSDSEPAPRSAPDSQQGRRHSNRLTAELEVTLFSDSNFYVGFTENISEGGLFVATYFTRPLGSKLEICVRIPGRADPLTLRGSVRWLRDDSPTSDGHPGMGIQFDAISKSDESDIAAFLGTRDPLFFVE